MQRWIDGIVAYFWLLGHGYTHTYIHTHRDRQRDTHMDIHDEGKSLSVSRSPFYLMSLSDSHLFEWSHCCRSDRSKAAPQHAIIHWTHTALHSEQSFHDPLSPFSSRILSFSSFLLPRIHWSRIQYLKACILTHSFSIITLIA